MRIWIGILIMSCLIDTYRIAELMNRVEVLERDFSAKIVLHDGSTEVYFRKGTTLDEMNNLMTAAIGANNEANNHP